MEAATVLTALSRMPVRDFHDFANDFHNTQLFKTTELMHEFSFYVRKALELSFEKDPLIKKKALSLKLSRANEVISCQEGLAENEVIATLSDQNFYWVINRIIHSKKSYASYSCRPSFDFITPETIQKYGFFQFFGHEFSVSEYSKEMREYNMRFFFFQSDHDDDDKMHCVDICDLMGIFMNHLFVDILKACGMAEELGYD